MVQILKSYLKRLTNLSSRNKSLLLLKDSFEQFIDLQLFDFVNNKPSYDIVNQLIAEKKSIYLCDEIDPRFEKINELSKRLKRIERTEKFIEQERGSEDLYVGYPFVKGKLMEGTVVRCPLLFFPVTLKLEKQKWLLVKRENEPISFNRSFLLAYSYFNNAKISDDFLEKTFEEFSKESLPFRTELFNFLKDSPLVLNFNQELFSDKLFDFDKLIKSDLDLSEKNGELKLQQQAVLGIFPQAGSFLVPDYEFLIENNANENIENSDNSNLPKSTEGLEKIFESKAKIIDFNTIKEEKIMAPFAMDASQELAIKKINAGHSMVIQGPPGTGKSQLICNLIADFAAAGKKVLVVCQKRAALDVVFQRLGTVGFQNFAALVHDFKNDRKTLFDQIANQIGLVDEYKRKNLSLDSLWLEQDFNQTSREIDRITKELDDFKTALFDIQECGISAKNLYLNSNPNGNFIDLKEKYKFFDHQQKNEFEKQLNDYNKYAEKLAGLDSFWENRLDYKNFKQSDLVDIHKILTQFQFSVESLKTFYGSNFNKKLNWHQIITINQEKTSLLQIAYDIGNINDWQLATYFYKNAKIKFLSENLSEKNTEIKFIFRKVGVEVELENSQFELMLSLVTEANIAQQTILSAGIYSFLSKDKSTVKSLLASHGLAFSKEGIQTLFDKLQNRKKLVNWLDSNHLLFANFEENYLRKKDLTFFLNYITELQKIQNLFQNVNKIAGIDFANILTLQASDVQEKLVTIQKLVSEFLDKNENISKYFTQKQIDLLLESPDLSKKIDKELNQYFDMFYEADGLKASFSHTEWAVVSELYENTAIDKISLFENSINLAWIDHIEAKDPILRAVSSLKMEQMEQDLQSKIIHKQTLSQQILLIKAREHTYNGLEYNRLKNLTTYRELNHQVTKKKKLWSIRQLFSGFSEEIFDLVPCWLASPETVSAVFPMETFFDLVIFDEASQCYAEAGLPAIFRGKQVVITGDSKQLQPSDLYAVRFEDETDEQPELEVNSLLDLAIQYLPQTQLNGHYRSQSIDLIDFSNTHFYKNKLQILPHFSHINSGERNMKMVKVEGIFENNVNIIEANEVVNIVKKLQIDSPNKSVGIVTFNYKQQNLIQDLLENEAIVVAGGPETLFVKNIENVQGDERDIILFSIGYGPDSKGKIRIQFGSLNQAGGENRLNVAITRARYQIIMVTSIWASQLNVDDTLNDGPKLLKKYMQYVKDVSDGNFKSQPFVNEEYTNSFSLKKLLQAQSQSLFDELPFADLVEKNKQNYESLLLTDDNLYFQSLSAKEAHAYWPINFKNKAWKFQKVYSREYWRKQSNL